MEFLYNIVNPAYAAAAALRTQCAPTPADCSLINKDFDAQLDIAVGRLRMLGLGVLILGGLFIFKRSK